MTDGIGRIFGSNSYNLNGFSHQKSDEPIAGHPETPQSNNNSKTLVDPSTVMNYLANNNQFIASVDILSTVDLDDATRARIAVFMENFELVYKTAVDEVGEDFAPIIVDLMSSST